MKYSEIEKTIRKDKYNALIFHAGGANDLYLVGGYIRDVIRGIAPHDRDYIVRGNALTFVRNIQKLTGGSIVIFKPKNTICLALKNGYNFDFSEFHGTIEENLSRRDFTMNALAWSPVTGLIDFYRGTDDIQKRTVSCISGKNMIDDPLCMLRAYRFSAELNGGIDRNTRQVIRHYHKRICSVSNERITLEMFHLLNGEQHAKHLKMALDDNLLTDILSCYYNALADNAKALHVV